MPHHGMTPHVSGSTLSDHARYAAGVREILECWFANRPIRQEYLIVDSGRLAGVGAHSYTVGDATDGADQAATRAPSASSHRTLRGPGLQSYLSQSSEGVSHVICEEA